ncbi:DUF192 domain-containing protein [Bowmanella dokdonensis]|uniref:DUF192 domain-containing protein n=1 Tax=Bowmanella dokdonensis TaxID=751969 RepID=A0A939DKC7_9ALTE|nr:DUF192 domain-containing protein [Bowmanella dokdonensis]MBN7824139.1 DUF192 domain-containing protein [Bowmanella dokdonensis]
MRLLSLLLIVVSVTVSAVGFGSVKVAFNDRSLTLELAKSYEQRAMGLMHRETLCEDCGMLFEYAQPREISMWMKNTLIPLDVAYLDGEGRVLSIKSMQPHDLTPVSSDQPASYAWEMNQGWFATQGIKPGDRVQIGH